MRWRVTVLDELGKRLLWGIYTNREEARLEAHRAKQNAYPARIRKVAAAIRAKIKP